MAKSKSKARKPKATTPSKKQSKKETEKVTTPPPTHAEERKKMVEEPPAPLISDGDSVEETLEVVEPSSQPQHNAQTGYSRLFSPYRTLGVVSQGPFHLLPNQNSSNAVLCTAIGERFHMLQCDRLHPVLVSQPVPATAPNTATTIQHIVSENSLSVTLVSHGPSASATRQLTLLARTQPIATLSLASAEWTIVDMIHLGKIQTTIQNGEKKGTKENALLCAVVLSQGKPVPDDGVPVVGEEKDDEDEDNTDDDSSVSSSESNAQGNNTASTATGPRGQVVLVVASRQSLKVHKRLSLADAPFLCPNVAVHPPTYVNKVILGGASFKTNRDAMVLLNVRTGVLIHTFTCLDHTRNHSEITTMENSPALDTIAVGTSQGMVHLVNTRMDVLLFSLSHISKESSKPTRITSLSFRTDGSALQYGIAPLAVGRADGTISVWDLAPKDTQEAAEGRTLLCEMERVHYPGGVYKLQYMPQEPLLVSTGTQSNAVVMHIFDNPDHSGRILRQRKGHTAPPKHIRYLHPGAGAGGGVLVNSGDGTDAAACQILSSGSTDRTLRIFSTVRSVLDKEYSQGKGLEKRAKQLGMKDKTEMLLPPVTAMASAEARSRDWGDLVTIHKDHAFAYVWSSKRGAQSGPVLRQDEWNVSVMKKAPPATAHATSVTLSTCGNFCLVGTAGGQIYKYNVQSGNTRGSFPPKDHKADRSRREAGDIRRTFAALEKKMKISNRASNLDKEEMDLVTKAKLEERKAAKLLDASHVGHVVTGLAVDGVNKTLISVGMDAKLILWNFKTHAPHSKCPIRLPAAATKLCHVRDSDLAAIALADFSAVLFDCSTLNICRRFGYGAQASCHTGPISDLGFSPDGRTLYSASLDSTIRVWDVPTNTCVDWLGFESAPTSLTVSPTGEFLATTHVGKVGISMWSDRSFYQTVHLEGSKSLTAPAQMDLPAPIAEVDASEEDSDDILKRILMPEERKDDDVVVVEAAPSGPAKAKEAGLITMSGLPPAHWKNLFHLELVKQRNKPKEPPKKPPSAPFFLQWRGGDPLAGEQPASKDVALPSASGGQAENEEEEWDAAWSDDDADQEDVVPGNPPLDGGNKRSRDSTLDVVEASTKKRRISHYRSTLATILEDCDSKTGQNRFSAITEHMATMGPSAIDVSLSSLCHGMHDLEDGLTLLNLACEWLVEACASRERFEAVNAYLHRFLHLHAGVIAGIQEPGFREPDNEGANNSPEEVEQREREREQRETLLDSIHRLREAQRSGSEALQSKMRNTLCLLRHFSRMV
eukprot:Nitzschia sp. Nitz4//scaffold17_size182527//38361//42191//NITZ4_001836-RA/size182527-processed-gene-0.43-mRNA-1//-1//CDS//3329539286//4815//frame0